MGSVINQSSLMQFFDVVQTLIKKFPKSFEFNENYIILFARLCCSKLPGVLHLPFLSLNPSPLNKDDIHTDIHNDIHDKKDDKKEEEEEFKVPNNIYSQSQFTSFIDRNLHLFTNKNFAKDKGEMEEGEILLPFSSSSDQSLWNDIFDQWRNSNTLFLLEECTKVIKENGEISDLLVKASSLISNMKNHFSKVEKFIRSIRIEEKGVGVKDVSLVVSPRFRTQTSLPRCDSSPQFPKDSVSKKENHRPVKILAKSLSINDSKKSKLSTKSNPV